MPDEPAEVARFSCLSYQASRRVPTATRPVSSAFQGSPFSVRARGRTFLSSPTTAMSRRIA